MNDEHRSEGRPVLTVRFDDALMFAADLHRHQTRKGTAIPYVSHLLAVASIVLEHGGREDEAIAALLHDGPEDQGGQATLDVIRDRFGESVAGIYQRRRPGPLADTVAEHVERLAAAIHPDGTAAAGGLPGATEAPR